MESMTLGPALRNALCVALSVVAGCTLPSVPQGLNRASSKKSQMATPFGSAMGHSTTRYTFTGQETLFDSSLFDYSARQYHSGLGRFLQVDSVFHAANASYTYVSNRPLSSIDPDGREEKPRKPRNPGWQDWLVGFVGPVPVPVVTSAGAASAGPIAGGGLTVLGGVGVFVLAAGFAIFVLPKTWEQGKVRPQRPRLPHSFSHDPNLEQLMRDLANYDPLSPEFQGVALFDATTVQNSTQSTSTGFRVKGIAIERPDGAINDDFLDLFSGFLLGSRVTSFTALCDAYSLNQGGLVYTLRVRLDKAGRATLLQKLTSAYNNTVRDVNQDLHDAMQGLKAKRMIDKLKGYREEMRDNEYFIKQVLPELIRQINVNP